MMFRFADFNPEVIYNIAVWNELCIIKLMMHSSDTISRGDEISDDSSPMFGGN